MESENQDHETCGGNGSFVGLGPLFVHDGDLEAAKRKAAKTIKTMLPAPGGRLKKTARALRTMKSAETPAVDSSLN